MTVSTKRHIREVRRGVWRCRTVFVVKQDHKIAYVEIRRYLMTDGEIANRVAELLTEGA